MKISKISSVLAIALTSSCAFAAINSNETTQSLVQSNNIYGGLQNLALVQSGIYKMDALVDIEPTEMIYNGESESNIGGLNVSAAQGEMIHVQMQPDGNARITFVMTKDNQEDEPDQIVLTPDLLKELPMTLVSTGSVEELYARESGYETVQEARAYGRYKPRARARRAKFARSGGRYIGRNGNCVSVVKALTGEGGTLGNGHAVAGSLARRGWKPISAGSLRRGAVCSWAGGRHGLGHTGYFDGHCFQPVYPGKGACGNPGSRYRMTRCVIRN